MQKNTVGIFSRRSYSLGELREREENNHLQTLALENEVWQNC